MTKLKWAPSFNGQTVQPPHRDTVWVPPLERERRKAKRAEEARKLQERSEQTRFKAILKKFGSEKAIALGVPREMIDAGERSSARRARKAKAHNGS